MTQVVYICKKNITMKNYLYLAFIAIFFSSCKPEKVAVIGGFEQLHFNLALTPYAQANMPPNYSNRVYLPLNNILNKELQQYIGTDKAIQSLEILDYSISLIEILPLNIITSPLTELDSVHIVIKDENNYIPIYKGKHPVAVEKIDNDKLLELYVKNGDLESIFVLIPKTTSTTTQKLNGKMEVSYNLNFTYKDRK